MAQVTFYDEFGIAPSATLEQIRKAHHALSRLLHPDLQTDPQLRHMAEIQMRRLNAMAATLLDPVRRRAYDSGLSGALVRVEPQPRQVSTGRRGVGVFAGIVVAGVILTGAILYLMAGDLIRVQTSAPSPAPGAVSAAEETADDPPEPAATATPPAAHVLPRMTSPYEGLWTYVASRNRASVSNPAPDPEFIELRISDDRGFLHGFYSTRSRVSPREMSNNFTFAGAATGNSTSLALRAADGSEGTIDLRIAGPNALQIDWNLNASTGSAVLARMN